MKKENKHTILYSIVRLVLFAAVFVVSFLGLEKRFRSDAKIHPVWKYAASEDHAPIDILFVGNSHTYSSVDGKMLSEATGLNIRELTCASANGVNVAADLEAFLNYEVPGVVVLEMCPFGADQINYDEMRKEKLGILFDHLDGIPDPDVRLRALLRVVSFEDVPAGLFQLFRSAMMWDRWSRDREAARTYDEYGAHVLFDVESGTGFFPNTVAKAYLTPSEGDTGLVPQNVEAFRSVIELAERYGFDIWIYNAPIFYYNQNYANLLRTAESMQNDHPCIRYIDNSMLHLAEIGIDRTDYYDEFHLNLDGMEKVSVWLGNRIAERLHTEFDINSRLQYKGCAVTMLENGNYRYEYETFCPGRHRFVYTKDGEEHDTGLTARNWFEEGALSAEEIETLYVTSRTAVKGEPGSIKHRFLPFTIESYSAKIMSGGIFLRNGSNFRGDLSYAWEVAGVGADAEEESAADAAADSAADAAMKEGTDPAEENTVRTTRLRHNNEIFLPFHESGTYEIRAITRQQSDGVTRVTPILTVSYDAESDRVVIEEALECVTVE